MSIDDNTSENTPVIKSRTGKFLQGMFDKKAPVRNMRRPRSTSTSQQEFMEVVPEPITWDEGEESNWDDDFVEAPQPGFFAPTDTPTLPTIEQPLVSSAPPPPPPTAFKTAPMATPEPIAEDPSRAITADLPMPNLSQPSATEDIADRSTTIPPRSPATSTPEIISPAPPRSTVAKAAEEGTDRSAPIEVSIPRPKNIKYKSKDPNAESFSTAAPDAPKNDPIAKNNAAIDFDIQRPKNIKYKTKPPVKASLPDRLLAPIKSLLAKISSPFDRTPKIYIEQVPADGKIPAKKSWQLPSLGHENLRQILMIAGALFLAMTVAWAVINFWPRSSSVAATPVTPTVQPAAPVKPVISPEAALLEAVKNRSQALANLYPAGLIANLELDNQQGLATITVGDLWFSLTPEQQQQTAQSLWQQARNYQMSGLEVRGTTNSPAGMLRDRLLARSPVVGTEAILTAQ
jgi:hypothetical protein